MKRSSKNWILREHHPASATLLSEELGLQPLIAQILVSRGIEKPEAADMFFSARLEDLHSPYLMKDMDKAVERIRKAIHDHESILIYGDYDADGVTGVATLLLFFRSLGIPVSFCIPNREGEGYGIHVHHLEKFLNPLHTLMITVDCGISSYDEILYAKDKGIDTVVTDHHEVPSRLPPACAIINPKQKDCAFPFKELAGVGIVLNLLMAVRKQLRDDGYWSGQNSPNLKDLLDVVALGTIADVVPLLDENRILVKHGLQELTQSRRPGIRALKEICGIRDETVTEGHVAYRLAPRLNAPGRMGHAEDSVHLLTTENPVEAEALAKKVNADNVKRQELERRILQEVKRNLARDSGPLAAKSLILTSSNWHPGVIGLCASRLLEEYSLPTVLITFYGNAGLGKGSGRSIDGFHLYEGLRRCEDLLEGFGGHEYAGGLTIRPDNLKLFCERFEAIASETLSDEDFVPKLFIDAEVPLEVFSPSFIEEKEKLAPFGTGNPEPVFSSSPLDLYQANVVGNGHLKLSIRENGRFYDAIGFRMGSLFPLPEKGIRIAFVPEVNEWRGTRRLQLRLKDLRLP